MLILIIGVIVLGGIFNPWTGIFANPTTGDSSEDLPEIKHKSFHLTTEG